MSERHRGLRIAVTGATSDFAAAILPRLFEDPEVDAVVGIARRPARITHPKFTSIRSDIRSPDLEETFADCDVVLHLAFVVEELKDKTETHDINLRGSRNVIDSAYRAGVSRVVVASSINAYGADIAPEPLTENSYPAGDPNRYYFYDKAEVEHYAEWWLRRHPGEMTISMLRCTYIVGPDFANDGIDQFTGPVGAFPEADRASYQFLFQDDMADAFHRAAKTDLVGPYNLGPVDWVGVRELAAMQGQLMFDVPQKAATRIANIAFALGITPFSGQWVTPGEPIVDSTALGAATGWAPTLTSHEAAASMILLQGKSLLRSADALERDLACEAALRPASDAIALARADVAGLDIEHRQLDIAGGRVHIEVHRSATATEQSVVLVADTGLHARYLTPLAAEIARAGVDVVVLDLPGHGLSTGLRGRSSATQTVDSVDAALRFVRTHLDTAPVALRSGVRHATDTLVGGLRRRATGWTTLEEPKCPDGLLPSRVRVDGTAALPFVSTAADALTYCARTIGLSATS
ncbi:NAD-dependent epimerase/dehydratase family protein [Rhodococcus sp. IEGM 1354]|uniref:NAD-dependent epimerase/dehydratase family protein n=1 Tax=Rhodococcus sp. IEGM 1354 TaxID=3047088 RepID=UPI0024B844A3|nr:NAD-dependent epimerase/dehydratase family protein [Rhodococcus sp. IEGM 1354]MDI9932012.1 NAD-dependent epimerase/dehydratase family protein [Rhodococcus sp. IEGM 1354]